MWISKKKLSEMEKKIAALEKEQLSIRELIKTNIDSNKNLLDFMKEFRNELNMLKTDNADIAK